MGDDSRRRTHAKRFVHFILYCELRGVPTPRDPGKKNLMSAELAFDTYVLLGNALHYLVSGVPGDSEAELGASPAAVASLYRKIEPLSPQQILATIAALPVEDKALLRRCCDYCLRTMGDDEVSAKLGLPRDVAENLLSRLFSETVTHA
jgi:hypothetical protein